MKNKSGYLLPSLYGATLSLAIVWGWELESIDHLELGNLIYLGYWLLFAVLIAILTRLSWNVIYKHARPLALNEDERSLIKSWSYSDKKSFRVTWLVMILCQIPVLLAEYPGFFCYDAQDELTEVLTRSFTTHHPLLHVLLLGGIIAAVHKVTGSYNMGIFCYIVIQMLVISGILAYVITYLKKRGISKKIRIVMTLFMGLFPTIVMYQLCSCKDGLFSAFLILAITKLIQFDEDEESFVENKCHCAGLIISATLMMLFRHNGFYAYLVMLPVIFIIKRRYIKKIAIMFIAPVLLYIVISRTMAAALGAYSGEHQEMLTVPIQQLARTYNAYEDEISEEDAELLKKYLPDEALNLYTPRVSDLLKSKFDNDAYDTDSVGFWKLWIKLGTRYPMTYLNAWLLTSYGYWYPGAVINVYQGNTMFTFTYTDSSYFGYEVEPPGERHSFIPIIDLLYRKLSIEKFQQNIPVISLFFSPAFYFWLYIYFAGMAAAKGKIRGFWPFALVLLVWLTVLLGPTYLVRYVVYLWFGLPLLFLTIKTCMGVK